MRKTIQAWDAGLQLLIRALGKDPSPRARMECDVCRAISIQFRSVYHVIRFYRSRDGLVTGKGSASALFARTDELKNIINAEIANSESILPVLERDPRIGFGNNFGQVYDMPMIREKIRQCKFVRDMEIPFLTRHLMEYNHLTFLTPEDRVPAE